MERFSEATLNTKIQKFLANRDRVHPDLKLLEKPSPSSRLVASQKRGLWQTLGNRWSHRPRQLSFR